MQKKTADERPASQWHSLFTGFIAFLVLIQCHHSSERFPSTVLSPDSVRIAYDRKGKGEPALIFIHGGSCRRSYWEKQIAYFSEYYTAVALDLAGHGESGTNRKAWTIEAFGADVAAVAEKLNLKKVILVGHSLGGPVMLEAAKTMSGSVIGLVGIDVFQVVGQKYSQEAIDRSVKRIGANFKATIAEGVRKNMFTAKSDPVLVEKIVQEICAASPEITLTVIEENYKWSNDRYIPALKELKVSVYCINADWMPTDEEGIRRYVPSFKVRYMKGLGHFLFLEDPENFNRLLHETIHDIISSHSD